MRKTRAFQLGEPGSAHFYHVVSRVAGREILFGDEEREAFMEILFKQLAFSGLKAIAWCFMGNHFHLLLEVPNKERMLAGWTEDDLIGRLASRGKLSLAQALRCRVRYMTDGVVLGSKGFVNGFFERKREHFGPKRESGARKLRGAEWGELRTLRDLRVDVIT